MISQDTRERLQKDSSRVTAAMAREMDPHGKSPNEAGAKLDYGKLRADSLLGAFAHALEAVAEVGEFGARKYSLNGWLEVPDGKQRYSEALVRHWLDDKKGEIIDRDSGLLVKAHLAWNALAVLELELRQRDS